MGADSPPAQPPRRRLSRRLLAAIAGVVLLGIIIWAVGQRESANSGARRHAAGPSVVPVAVATVARHDIRITQQSLGTVTPLATVTVQAQVSGKLTRVGFTEGQTVKKGDFLAQIDPRPYEAALAQAQGQLARDRASLGQARMDLVRYQQLAAKNSIVRQQAEDQKWIVAQNEGAVRLDEAQVSTATINLGFCRIESPTDGRIGLRLVDPGNIVQVGGTSGLAVITRMQPMTVVFVVPEDSLPQVMSRKNSGANLEVLAYDRSGTRLLGTGTLSAIDSQINTTTGTVSLKAQFPNGSEALFPNQFVNVVLRVDELPGAVAVPTAAIQHGSNGDFAYVVKPDSTVAMTTIRLGPIDGDLVAVQSGLVPGERVVIDGADKLRDGAKVAVRQGA